MNYTAKGKYNRYFELFDTNNMSIGELDYPKWYAVRYATIASGGRTYEISPTGFFRNGSIVTSGDAQICMMKFHGLGRMTITMENGPVYTFRRVGFFNGYMALFNEHDREIIKITQTTVWAIWNREYAVATDDNYSEGMQPFLILLLVYCANYLRAVATS